MFWLPVADSIIRAIFGDRGTRLIPEFLLVAALGSTSYWESLRACAELSLWNWIRTEALKMLNSFQGYWLQCVFTWRWRAYLSFRPINFGSYSWLWNNGSCVFGCGWCYNFKQMHILIGCGLRSSTFCAAWSGSKNPHHKMGASRCSPAQIQTATSCQSIRTLAQAWTVWIFAFRHLQHHPIDLPQTFINVPMSSKTADNESNSQTYPWSHPKMQVVTAWLSGFNWTESIERLQQKWSKAGMNINQADIGLWNRITFPKNNCFIDSSL